MRKDVELSVVRHYPGTTMGFAEGKINKREFVASWYNKKDLGGIYYDDWRDTTAADNRLIIDAVFKKRGAACAIPRKK
jgi:hypothetical protein